MDDRGAIIDNEAEAAGSGARGERGLHVDVALMLMSALGSCGGKTMVDKKQRGKSMWDGYRIFALHGYNMYVRT